MGPGPGQSRLREAAVTLAADGLLALLPQLGQNRPQRLPHLIFKQGIASVRQPRHPRPTHLRLQLVRDQLEDSGAVLSTFRSHGGEEAVDRYLQYFEYPQKVDELEIDPALEDVAEVAAAPPDALIDICLGKTGGSDRPLEQLETTREEIFCSHAT